MSESRNIWWRVRWTFYALHFVGGLARSAFLPTEDPELAKIFDFPLIIVVPLFVLIFAAIPLMTAAVISFQAINPFTAPVWQRPTHGRNPFQLRDPLHFFHFAAHAILACGVGIIVGSPFSHFRGLVDGVFVAVASLAVIAGIQLAMKWCSHKLQPNELAS